MKFHRALLLSLGPAAASFALPGCNHSEGAVPPSSQGQPPPFEVTVMRVVPRDLPWTQVHVAQTSASREVEVRARVGGLLESREFVEGAFVHRGDVLYRIDPRPSQAAVQAAEARLAESKARLEESQRTLARKQQLFESQSIAKREVEDAQTGIALSDAQIASAEAALARAQLDLEYSTVVAPLDGRVGKALQEAGSVVDTMTNSLLTTISALDPIYVSFRVSERELLDAARALESGTVEGPRSGAELRVAVELIDGRRYEHEGHINFRSVAIDPTTGTAEVRAALPNAEERLQPGQFVRAYVLGLVRAGSITVPQRAVQMGAGASTVYVVGADDVVEARTVQLLSWQGSDWLVESGLSAGERVIVDGIQKVRPGAKVSAVEAPIAEASAPR